MLKIAFVLTHNKTDKENFNQIEALKPFVSKVTETITRFNEDTGKDEFFDIYHYEIKGINTPHEAKFYQILPFGVKEPSNFYDIDSHNVLYRKGDEDKTGDHPRFFNWGLKRGTDYGADVVVTVGDVGKLDVTALENDILKLYSKTDTTELIDSTTYKAVTSKVLKEVGQLDETKTLTQAITDLKAEMATKGMTNG